MHEIRQYVQNFSWISWRRRCFHSLLTFIIKTFLSLVENRLLSPFCVYHSIATISSVVYVGMGICGSKH